MAALPLASTASNCRKSAFLEALIIIFTASGALCPSAIASKVFGPRRGSVIFWLATTPTPAFAWAQRAATAGDDDDTAIPSWSVLVHLATIENVMI